MIWRIDVSRISLGTKVTLYDLDTDEEVMYQILSGDDAEFYQNAISAKSPIARGLIGREESDEVKIKVPAGVKSFEVIKIERFS
jgi:transcription elongation factor GreA